MFPQPESEFVHDVLWTSGWDSTFRVADLVITYGRAVRPHYLIDPSRLSTEKELTTITELSDAIAARREDGGSLLLPPRLHQRSELSTDPETRAQLRRLRTIAYLGPQYDLLVALARRLASHELELCILKGDWAYQLLRLVDADVTCDRAPPPDDVYRLVDDPSHPDLAVFASFRFPVLEMTKVQMGEEASRRGFADVMEMTWFCRRPTRRGEPCGICGPCLETRDEGLGRRVPDVSGPRRLARRLDHRARRYARRAMRVGRKETYGSRGG